MNLYQRLKIATAINGDSINSVAQKFGCHPNTLWRLDEGPLSKEIKDKAIAYIHKAEKKFQAHLSKHKVEQSAA